MSTSSQPNLQTGGVTVPITAGETLQRTAEREGSILLARNAITITHARYAAGQLVSRSLSGLGGRLTPPETSVTVIVA